MSGNGPTSPWTRIDGIDCLRVPGHIQPDKEPECLIYAMWMVLQFISTVYPNPTIRGDVDVLKPDEMKDFITIRESGWSPDQRDLDALSEQTHPVKWELKTWYRAPPANTFDSVVEAGLENTLPTIAVVDTFRLEGRNQRGPLHAVVVTGKGNNRVVVNDPWGRMYDVYPRDTIVDAWDTTLNRLVTIDLSEQSTLQTNLGDEETDE